MSPSLTGEYDVVVQASPAAFRRVLAAIHARGQPTAAELLAKKKVGARFLHSGAALRVVPKVPKIGVAGGPPATGPPLPRYSGLVDVQLSTPKLTLPASAP